MCHYNHSLKVLRAIARLIYVQPQSKQLIPQSPPTITTRRHPSPACHLSASLREELGECVAHVWRLGGFLALSGGAAG